MKEEQIRALLKEKEEEEIKLKLAIESDIERDARVRIFVKELYEVLTSKKMSDTELIEYRELFDQNTIFNIKDYIALKNGS